jgi:hypothetical protein
MVSSFTREKFISEGVKGKVYLAKSKDSNETYAMKVEYVSGPDDRSLSNELEFIKKVASKHPDQFMQLIDYRIVDNCEEPSPPPVKKWLSQYSIDWLKQLRSSKFCVEKVYTLVDTTLNKIKMHELTLEQRYSCLIQVLYIVHLFESNGYVHGDFHAGNIGVLRVDNKKQIEIFGQMIPTFGYQYQAIDYGGILHKKSASKTRLYQEYENVTEYAHFQEHKLYDKYLIISKMYTERNFWKFLDANRIKIEDADYIKIVLEQPEAKLIKSMSKHKAIRFKIFKLLFTKKYQQIVLGNHFKKKIETECFIPSVDIMFCYQNFDDIKLAIEYLIERLNDKI